MVSGQSIAGDYFSNYAWNSISGVRGQTAVTQIKVPPVYDVSHWKEIPDFKLVNPRPVLFITKATEAHPGTAYNHTDDKFIRFATGMMQIGCIRGFFHFNRKDCDATKQAEHFIDIISQTDILSTDLLILDFEEPLSILENGLMSSRLWAWFERVKHAFPKNLLMLYSRKNILDPIVMTNAEKEYFKKIPTWTAGYPFLPDLYSVIPSAYTPDQSKWGAPGLWQYSDKGIVEGIQGSVDLNLITPFFLNAIGNNIIGEIAMANYMGKCTTTAKVWADVGGLRKYPDVWVGAAIKADGTKPVAGVKYIHLTSPIVGWSKAEWFAYTEVVVVPPPPPPVVIPTFPFEIGITIGSETKTYVLKP
jgi:GH25 family lysozyme M1 (1,4-beta-N-acetylmuramidase)